MNSGRFFDRLLFYYGYFFLRETRLFTGLTIRR